MCSIKKLSGYTYNYNTEEFKDKDFSKEQQIGFIAQELKEVFPQLIKEDNKGYLAVNYVGMIPVLLEAIKAQQKQLDKQDSVITQLTNAINNCCTATNAGSNQLATSGNQTIGGAVLYQNTPNPWNQTTVVKCYVPQSSQNVSLLVFDLNGTLKNTFAINETGTVNITINANQLVSGMYYYTLVINGKEVDTKKMILTQ